MPALPAKRPAVVGRRLSEGLGRISVAAMGRRAWLKALFRIRDEKPTNCETDWNSHKRPLAGSEVPCNGASQCAGGEAQKK